MRFSRQDHDNESECHRHGQRSMGGNKFFILCYGISIARAAMRRRARLKGALGVSRASRDDVKARRASDWNEGEETEECSKRFGVWSCHI